MVVVDHDMERKSEIVSLNIVRNLARHSNNVNICNMVVPPYQRIIRTKTYRGYVKPRIKPNTLYNVIFA
jgi:hypothetical protein